MSAPDTHTRRLGPMRAASRGARRPRIPVLHMPRLVRCQEAGHPELFARVPPRLHRKLRALLAHESARVSAVPQAGVPEAEHSEGVRPPPTAVCQAHSGHLCRRHCCATRPCSPRSTLKLTSSFRALVCSLNHAEDHSWLPCSSPRRRSMASGAVGIRASAHSVASGVGLTLMATLTCCSSTRSGREILCGGGASSRTGPAFLISHSSSRLLGFVP